MHRQDDVLSNRPARERNPLLGQAAQDDARIGCSVDRIEPQYTFGKSDAAAHRGREECLFRREVAKDGGGCDVQIARDVGERRRGEALLRERHAGAVQDLIAADRRRPAHL